MCKLKSAIVLKDRIFMPDYDSHSDMLKELGIKDDYLGASKTFVRAELSPKNGDMFSDIDGWELTVDQDITPDWFDPDETKARMIEKTKEWAKTHIHIGVEGLKISVGQNHYIKDCEGVEIRGSATVKYIYGSATVENICDSATVEYIYDSATVKNICGSATVEKASGHSVICASPWGPWHRRESTVLLENSTLKDNYGKVIYQAGEYQLVHVKAK